MRTIRSFIRSLPIVGPLARRAWRVYSQKTFTRSGDYWDNRYRHGGSSGSGSYGQLAMFKAKVINEFVQENKIGSAIEFGCGDGSQLELINYPEYVGVDVSEKAVQICKEKFSDTSEYSFYVVEDYDKYNKKYDLALSLDVIYHLVEDEVFHRYMENLFNAAKNFVAIYSSDFDSETESAHVRHRKFTDWISSNAPEWELLSVRKNEFPLSEKDIENTSVADFYFYRKPV